MIRHIINHLKTVTAVTAIIGSDPIKAFAGEAEKRMANAAGNAVDVAAPYVLFLSRGGDPLRDMDGRIGTREVDFLVEAVSFSMLEAESLYTAVGDALDVAAHDFWDGIEVQYSEIDEPTNSSVPPTAGEQKSLKVLSGHLFVRANY